MECLDQLQQAVRWRRERAQTYSAGAAFLRQAVPTGAAPHLQQAGVSNRCADCITDRCPDPLPHTIANSNADAGTDASAANRLCCEQLGTVVTLHGCMWWWREAQQKKCDPLGL